MSARRPRSRTRPPVPALDWQRAIDEHVERLGRDGARQVALHVLLLTLLRVHLKDAAGPAAVRRRDLAAFLATIGPGSVREALAVLRAFFASLVEQGHVAADPTRSLAAGRRS